MRDASNFLLPPFGAPRGKGQNLNCKLKIVGFWYLKGTHYTQYIKSNYLASTILYLFFKQNKQKKNTKPIFLCSSLFSFRFGKCQKKYLTGLRVLQPNMGFIFHIKKSIKYSGPKYNQYVYYQILPKLNAFILLGYEGNTMLAYKHSPEKTGFNMYAENTQQQLIFLALLP